MEIQGGNNLGGSEFNTLLASTPAMQLNANNYYSFNSDNSAAYKVYRFNILGRTGTYGSATGDIGISLLQFNTSTITALMDILQWLRI